MRSTRRDFLRYSSTAAAGFAIAAMSQSALFGAQQNGIVPLLSVGYAPELPRTSVRLSNASRILSPDPTFLSRDVRVSIRGGRRAEKVRKDQGGVAVDVISASGNAIFFWSANRFDAGRSGSIVLQTGATNGVSFSVKNLAAKTESILTLGLLSRSDPRLRRGVYVVAVRENPADAAPDWSRFDLVRDGDHFVIPNAPVSHAILSVDYAG